MALVVQELVSLALFVVVCSDLCKKNYGMLKMFLLKIYFISAWHICLSSFSEHVAFNE